MTTPRKKRRVWRRDRSGHYHTGNATGKGTGAVVWATHSYLPDVWYWTAWRACASAEGQWLPTLRAAKAAAEAWLDEQDGKP